MAQTKKQDVVDASVPRDSKAETVTAGEPVEAVAVTQLGGTFAERKKAREAADKKAVSGRSAENKAVKAADSK